MTESQAEGGSPPAEGGPTKAEAQRSEKPSAPGRKEAPSPAKAEKKPEGGLEDLPLVKAIRAFCGEGVEEVSSFTGKEDELTVVVRRDLIHPLCRHLKDPHGFNLLADLCGVHYPDRDRPLEVVYHLYAMERRERLRLKVRLGEEEAAPTVTDIWRAANWLEREAYDMVGISFEGHPDLRRILLPDDWEGHPLRKEYPVRGDGFGLQWVERHIPPAARPRAHRE
jgi:NADH-quinone oxidoreductase subunit C